MLVLTRPGNQETMGLKPAVDHSAYGQRGWLEYMEVEDGLHTLHGRMQKSAVIASKLLMVRNRGTELCVCWNALGRTS